MRDHVTEERISAYVDGELEGDELQLVERQLAESAEYRQLLAELQELRASVRAVSSFNLPAGFHSRIVDQIDELAVSPSQRLPSSPARDSKKHPWRRVFLAATSLAAVVAVTMMLRQPTDGPIVPGPIVPGPGSVRTTPVVMPAYMKHEPNLVMVYDITVTSVGQENEAVDKLLAKLGIGIDPRLRLDGELEKDLVAIRESQVFPGVTNTTPYKSDHVTPKSDDSAEVEMVYIAATLGALDEFGVDLYQMSDLGKEVSQVHFDMVFEPNKLGVMHRLHNSAREHLAQSTDLVPSKIGQAFRLAFDIKLTSVAFPGAALFQAPPAQAAEMRIANAIDGRDADQVPFGSMEPGHILLIIRNVDANRIDVK
jgi:Putative zinc-finger